jgi:HEPN domain-containing protein/predicted nucleotidyltransferase
MERDEILNRIKEGVLRNRHDVVSIVVFGSFTRGGLYHDIDVLVVVQELKLERLQRGPDMVALSRALRDLPVPAEILLYSCQECRENASAHMPLFLDVACDGLVLYDNDFIRPLLAGLRHYIAERGIQRTETGGWRFPVAFRQSTALSKLKNRDWVNMWLDDAQRDLAAADHLFQVDIYDKCVTHRQQTVEKAVKAVLACLGRLERTHYVAGILESESQQLVLDEWRQRLQSLAEWAQALEPAATWSRYPGERGGRVWMPAREYDKDKAMAALESAHQALATAKEFSAWWFAHDDAETSTGESN